MRLPRAPSTSWLTANTSSLVSSASVQASVLSRAGLPPYMSGDGSMLHSDMIVTCSFLVNVVWSRRVPLVARAEVAERQHVEVGPMPWRQPADALPRVRLRLNTPGRSVSASKSQKSLTTRHMLAFVLRWLDEFGSQEGRPARATS